MSEIRKPFLTILLKREGKRTFTKIELFRAELWDPTEKRKIRIRHQGKWFDANGKFIYKTQFMNILSKSLPI